MLAAALHVLDAEGLDAVTMRRVAEQLDTGPASLYAHVSDKDDLVDALLDLIIGELDISDRPDPQRWQDQLKQWVRDTRTLFARHNDIARASLGRVPTGVNALPVVEWTLAVLKAGNVPDQVAAWSADILALYAGAVAYEESIERVTIGDEAAAAAYHENIHRTFQSLDPAEFPVMFALSDALVAGGGDERFEFGLDLLVRGIASTVPGRRGGRAAVSAAAARPAVGPRSSRRRSP